MKSALTLCLLFAFTTGCGATGESDSSKVRSAADNDSDLIQSETLDGGTLSGPAQISRGMILHVDAAGHRILTGTAVLTLQYNGNLRGSIHAFIKFNDANGNRGAMVALSTGSVTDPSRPTTEITGLSQPNLMAGTANGPVLNAWDVEVAFVDDHNHWDSNYGRNFKFRFDKRNLSL